MFILAPSAKQKQNLFLALSSFLWFFLPRTVPCSSICMEGKLRVPDLGFRLCPRVPLGGISDAWVRAPGVDLADYGTGCHLTLLYFQLVSLYSFQSTWEFCLSRPALSHRTLLDDGSVLCLCCPLPWPLAFCGCWPMDTWLVQQRNWVFNLV